MHRKTLSVILAILLVAALAACSSSAESETITDPSESIAASQSTEPSDETEPEQQAPEFEELVLVDDENCTFKITAVDAESIWGYALNVYMENKTDKNLMFTVDDVSVNGYMCDPFWAVSVAAGKMANDQISFMAADFEKNGIETVTDITFTLRVYDNDDLLSEDLTEQTFTVNP